MKNPKSLALIINVCLAMGLLQSGCGTVVGNPKKPDETTTPPTAVVQLPMLPFELPKVAQDSDAELQLTAMQAGEQFGSDRDVLVQWGGRTTRLVKLINRTSESLNAKLLDIAPNAQGDYVVDLGNLEGPLMGRVSTLQDADYDFEAVICLQGKPIVQMQWTDTEEPAVSLIRNFKVKTEADSTAMDFVSVVTYEPGVSDVFTIETQGTLGEASAYDGAGINEFAVSERFEDRLEIKMVADWYLDQPQDESFEGDAYFSGRLYHDDDATAGELRGQAEFVAYHKARKLLCRQGFDEDSAVLWQPKLLGNPRWCVGRPLGGSAFASYEDFLNTVSSLKAVGVASKTKLRKISMPADATCPTAD